MCTSSPKARALLARAPALVLAPLLLIVAARAQSGTTVSQAAGSSSAAGTRFRMLRSVSGSTGREVDGRFVVDDPRTFFSAGTDHKVIVYVEWEGPTGPHHFEGLWKNPEGKIVLLSDFNYAATKSQFSGYWTMLLPDSPQLGEWTLEARIDGESAGTHSFVVGSAAGAANAEPVYRVRSVAEIYQQAQASSVVVEKLAADGAVLSRASGFWVGEGRILTAFEAIDGAYNLRMILANGDGPTTDKVLAWSRWQDWALVLVPDAKGPALKRATKGSLKVGDQCVFLETSAEGGRVIANGSIIGRSSLPQVGDRLYIASPVSVHSVGGALLNEYGEFVGVVGGSTVPGADSQAALELQGAGTTAGGRAVPASLISDPSPGATATSLQQLWQQQQFIPPTVKSGNLGYATLTSAIEKGRRDAPPWPRDYRVIFSREDTRTSAFASWQPQMKQKGQATLRVFDVENHLLMESKPVKLDLHPGSLVTTFWSLPMSSLSPGTYRAEIVFDSNPIWRSFFRITE